MKNPGEKIAELRAFLNEQERLYRIENSPQISDAKYDELLAELKRLEAEYPQFADGDSPTQKLGDDSSKGFEKRAHLSKMLSLDNVFNIDELREFDARLKKVLGTSAELTYAIEPKIDGAGVSAVYENGKLVRLLTRGNGTEGDDITRNLSVIKNIPRELKGGKFPKLLEVRGEVCMLNSDFEKIRAVQLAEIEAKNEAEFDGDFSETQKPKKKENVYANPRNLAAGTLKLLDESVLSTRALYATFYSIGSIDGEGPARQSGLAEWLKNLGLPAMDWSRTANGVDEVFEKIEALDKDRKQFDFNTDGAVLKLDDMSLYTLAGWTSKAPRWAVAWKYKPQQAEAVIREITLQIGRTGAITPVAELEDASRRGENVPIALSGSNVSRATLHNFEEIIRKDIRVGDCALIEKAGEIIPIVVRVLPEKRLADSCAFREPCDCPACNSSLVRNPAEAVLRCVNPECPEQVRRRIIHFASRGCMDIEGLGDAVVSELVDLGLVKNFSEIYFLKADDLYKIKNFKDKSVENLLAAIEESKSRDLWRLVSALGIPYVGERVAKDLALEFKDLSALIAADMGALKNVTGVGDKIIYSLLTFFESPDNLRIIEKLKESGVKFNTVANASGAAFAGKIFVLTGALQTMGRTEAKRLIESFGGRVASGVSASTDYLVCESEGSSKLKKAQELGVKIVNEKDFVQMLESANPGETKAPAPQPQKESDGDQLMLF